MTVGLKLAGVGDHDAGDGRIMTSGTACEGGFFYVLDEATHILFVDDDPIIREFATVHLSTDTAEVVLAADGIEALEATRARRPDIILLDLEMPRLDGFETLARLRADPATRELPVIVVTGREDVGAIDRAFDAGATSFLVKPINWRLLSYQIRYVLRAGRAEAGSAGVTVTPCAPAAVSEAALMDLAREGAALIRLAMGGGAELRRSAVGYAVLLAETVGPSAPQQGHG